MIFPYSSKHCNCTEGIPSIPRSAFRAIKNNPGSKIFGELFKTMLHSGRNKKHITGFERPPFSAIHKNAGSGNNEVKLIPAVRCLKVFILRSVILHKHAPMFQHFYKTFLRFFFERCFCRFEAHLPGW